MGLTKLVVKEIEIAKPHPKTPAGADGFKERLFGCEAGGVMLVFELPALAIFDFPGCENFITKTDVAGEGFLDPRHFDDVDAGTYDHENKDNIPPGFLSDKQYKLAL